jgi:hypothetical protein
MKKMMALVATLVLAFTACADDYQRVVQFRSLPVSAQSFIQKHFNQEDVLRVVMEKEGLFNEYSVYMKDATEIDFNHQGNLLSVDCQYSPVPASIMPQAVVDYVNYHFPDAYITDYVVKARRLEVGLNNDLELIFDLDGNFLGIDD